METQDMMMIKSYWETEILDFRQKFKWQRRQNGILAIKDKMSNIKESNPDIAKACLSEWLLIRIPTERDL